MSDRVVVVLLAGALRPSPLRAALDMPVIGLPMGPHGTLLDTWLDTARSASRIDEMRIVVNDMEQVQALQSAQQTDPPNGASAERAKRATVRMIAEPASWRGPAGILRDVTEDLVNDEVVIAAESQRLPPASFQPLLDAIDDADECVGVVGTVVGDEPAGVFAFRREALGYAPTIGYCDVKEQLLPRLHDGGRRVIVCPIAERTYPLRDRREYFEALQRSLRGVSAHSEMTRIAASAVVDSSTTFEGACVVEHGAMIGEDVILQDTVVMRGAAIGVGAVVSQSIIGPGIAIEPRKRVARQIVYNRSGESFSDVNWRRAAG